MKAKIFFGLTAGIVAVAAVAIVTISSVNARSTQSDLIIRNLEALATPENGDGTLWQRSDYDCTYTFQGQVGSTITVAGVKIKIGADGTASYTIPGGRTECASGGNQQCVARYCPSKPV